MEPFMILAVIVLLLGGALVVFFSLLKQDKAITAICSGTHTVGPTVRQRQQAVANVLRSCAEKLSGGAYFCFSGTLPDEGMMALCEKLGASLYEANRTLHRLGEYEGRYEYTGDMTNEERGLFLLIYAAMIEQMDPDEYQEFVE